MPPAAEGGGGSQRRGAVAGTSGEGAVCGWFPAARTSVGCAAGASAVPPTACLAACLHLQPCLPEAHSLGVSWSTVRPPIMQGMSGRSTLASGPAHAETHTHEAGPFVSRRVDLTGRKKGQHRTVPQLARQRQRLREYRLCMEQTAGPPSWPLRMRRSPLSRRKACTHSHTQQAEQRQ